MKLKVLYVGMRNRGGPGKIGALLKSIIEEEDGEFYWLHNSRHISAAFDTEDDISLEATLCESYDLIIHNQWRSKTVFSHFNGKVPQTLLVMYEDIPIYWEEFCFGLNSILAPCSAVGEHLKRKFNVIHFAVPPRRFQKKTSIEEINHFFFPARDGGEACRKGLPEFASALEQSQGEFTVALSLTKDALSLCKLEFPSILSDSRVNILPELTEDEYWAQMDSCNALLCPSRTSGIELAPLDAIASGIDIVITNIAPMNEYYLENEAFLIQPDFINLPTQRDNLSSSIDSYKASSKHLAAILDNYKPNSKMIDNSGFLRWEKFKRELKLFFKASCIN